MTTRASGANRGVNVKLCPGGALPEQTDHTNFFGENMSSISSPSLPAAQLADMTIDELHLVAFIERWNSGEASLIRHWDDFDLALTFDSALDHRLDAARTHAAHLEIAGEFEAAIRAQLAPVISASYQSGLAIQCETWARAVAESSPVSRNAPAPFRDEESWIAWCLHDCMRPPFANPVGEPLLSQEQEEMLLTNALRLHCKVAARAGWLPG
jgi:hypothetical protein